MFDPIFVFYFRNKIGDSIVSFADGVNYAVSAFWHHDPVGNDLSFLYSAENVAFFYRITGLL